MHYQKIVPGIFLSRPNRFIANIEIDGTVEVCHVKNTGRCRELLVPGARVFVQVADNPHRKTKFDLISVCKGNQLINMDSQAPNKVFAEWISNGDFFGDITYLKPECKYNNSRFDFYIESCGHKAFVEVKGVTLENEGVVSFPDAPTERGVKHLKELADAVKAGYDAYVFFIIQMSECKYFTPNRERHPEFADALAFAENSGVKVVALTCKVTETELSAENFAEVRI